MSNHVHLVFRSTNGIPPGQLLGSFKRHTSMAVVKAIKENDRESRKENLLETFKRNGSKKSNVTYNQFWRQDNKPIELWSNFVISQKIRYSQLRCSCTAAFTSYSTSLGFEKYEKTATIIISFSMILKCTP